MQLGRGTNTAGERTKYKASFNTAEKRTKYNWEDDKIQLVREQNEKKP